MLMSLSTNGTNTYLSILNHAWGIDKDLLVNKLYDTTACKSLLSYKN